MIFACTFKQRHGKQFCVTDCAASAPCGVFEYVRVERPEDVPPADPHAVDVAVLDMNHGWPNLGHDSLVHAVMDASCEAIESLEAAGLRVRVLSYDVRRCGMVPEPPGSRFSLYLGTGGPGHIDPRRNDGIAPESQGIRENPEWEEVTFQLFDACGGRRRASARGSSRTCCPRRGARTRGSATSPRRSDRKRDCGWWRTGSSTSCRDGGDSRREPSRSDSRRSGWAARPATP